MSIKRLPAILFPGQGNQKRAMLENYFKRFPSVVKPILEELDESLKQNFSKLLIKSSDADIFLPDIDLTSNAQPAILTTSYTIIQILKSQSSNKQDFFSSKFSYALGHSLGEFSSASAVGILDFSDAVKLVHLRGKAMESSKAQFSKRFGNVKLGMYVTLLNKISSSDIIKIFDEKYKTGPLNPNELSSYVDIGNINSSSQVVFSGPQPAIYTILSELQTHYGIKRPFKTIPLNVSAPFHSPIMLPAQEYMEALVSELEASGKIGWPSEIPIISNITKRPFESKQQIIRSFSHSCTDRVYWYDSIKYAVNERGIDKFVSIGPGNIGDLTKRDLPKTVSLVNVTSETLEDFIANFN
ncbi:uncharacterized protein SAPINGB_P003339 [Magnusiomyces paraingens]|uniref:[acyl-carrier-protein] S-malonyltransferase n=1 Tax=Magnusiomyces paraingens TaxID=2606893 RepID=A0A5E8BPW8_9ASCO|nr:uncharacterized protein SAPINGB_P003339 [Saprochaete ingens]VVT52971.1 unnamed protein product [Saprochaete ingens]